MVGRFIAGAVALGLSLFPGQAAAQPEGWTPILNPATFGNGVGACWAEGENSACLLLVCRDGGPFEIGLMAYGGNFGLEPELPVFIRVDGGPAFALRMTPLNAFNFEHAAVTYDPARHAGLLQALRSGQSATVAIDDASQNPRPYPLGNRPGVVDAAMSQCGAPALTSGQAGPPTPVTDPGRFVQVDPALRDPRATELARTLMADTLAAEPGTEASASVALLPDGRQILVVEHGVSTASYGITGVGTYLFTAEPGGPFRQVYSTTGVAVWLDTAQLSEGYPDLWVRNYRGVAQPFGVWRYTGGRYAHQRNVPSQ
jgi:hypothetical protein